jgi:hypothetical protein
LCSAVAWSVSEVVVQLSHRYGATQLTTRQATPPLHRTCVLHCPYRKALQQWRRWSQVWVEPLPHEQLQHFLSQMWSPVQPLVQPLQVALQSTM